MHRIKYFLTLGLAVAISACGDQNQAMKEFKQARATSKSTNIFEVRNPQYWTVDSLHWDPMTTIDISLHGNWAVSVGRLANLRREGWGIDQGRKRAVGIHIQLFVDPNCNGPVRYETDFPITVLNYKGEAPSSYASNKASGHDRTIGSIGGAAKCMRYWGYWRGLGG